MKLRTFTERHVWTTVLGVTIGAAAVYRCPFADENALLELVRLHEPLVYFFVKYGYIVMLFTTPCIALALVSSLYYIFLARTDKAARHAQLPPYPNPTERDQLFLVVGEQHHPRRPEPTENPRWLTIPDRGLFTGIAIFGAIGTGKTSGCMYPFAEQILSFRANNKERRIGGLVLEVKGDFCRKVRSILKSAGREEDFVELSLDGPYRYNPLYNDLDAYALAFGIASLLSNLYGKGKEPFWQQAYTNLVKFLILLHKIVDDYVTLHDVYACAINPDLVEEKIRQGEALFEKRHILITHDDFIGDDGLERFPFDLDTEAQRMKAAFSEDLERYLTERRIEYELQIESSAPDESSDEKRHQFEAVKRWFYHDWSRIDNRLRTSIVEGISVFLSLFDDNPSVKRVFCPPKQVYDPVANADGRYGKPLPPFSELIERGAVCALNFPLASNPGLARVIGTLMKQDFQRAMLNRIPQMEREPERHFREVLFLCDEYQGFATAGENDPSGDEKFFALARQAKCIAIVATQSISSLRSTLPGESWRTLLQTFRTKIFLTLADDFSARTASELCGKEELLKPSYTISENGQDAGVSVLTGRATAGKATLSASKAYHIHRDFTFEAKVFAELTNAQAIVLAYDGLNPHPPSYCYLKPYYLDPNRSYFEQLLKGEL